MGLFNFGKKKESEFIRNEVKRMNYTLSDTFKGYKRILLSTGYDFYKGNEDMLIQKHGEKTQGLPANIVIIDNNKDLYAELVVDGIVLGAIWSTNEHFNEILNEKVSAIRVYVENGNIKYFFKFEG